VLPVGTGTRWWALGVVLPGCVLPRAGSCCSLVIPVVQRLCPPPPNLKQNCGELCEREQGVGDNEVQLGVGASVLE